MQHIVTSLYWGMIWIQRPITQRRAVKFRYLRRTLSIRVRRYFRFGPFRGGHRASPRNTVRARFSLTTSSSFSLPIRLPSRAFGTVVILSIINRDALERPLRSVGSISIRSKGASVGSVVNAHSVMELVASNRSSCTITAGRGLPAYGAPPDTVHTSPRFIIRDLLKQRQ